MHLKKEAMKKLINVISGLIAGLAPLVFAVIFGILIYNEIQNFIGISIGLILAVAAIWVGIKIYKSIQRKGIFDFLTVVNASPDLDNLEPTKDSKTKKRTPKELAELNKKRQTIFKGGTIKIFGDWFGEPYENFMKIVKINYDDSKKQMIIQFEKQTRIIIDEPDHILESPTVLKILSAKKIQLEFQHEKKNSKEKGNFFKTYTIINNKLKTDTNIDWTNSKIDASIGQDAIIIFG